MTITISVPPAMRDVMIRALDRYGEYSDDSEERALAAQAEQYLRDQRAAAAETERLFGPEVAAAIALPECKPGLVSDAARPHPWVCEYKVKGGRTWRKRIVGVMALDTETAFFVTQQDAQAWLCGRDRYPHERFRNVATGETIDVPPYKGRP